MNSGAFDVTSYEPLGSGNIATIPGFADGDKVSFTVSGRGGDFELLNGTVNTALASQVLSGSPTPTSYTVTGTNSDTTLVTHFSIHTIPYSITIVATCTSAQTSTPNSSSDAWKALVRGFLVGRINGILLNDPGATSLLNRTNAPVPQQMASTSRGGMNVASNAAALDGVMGLGASRFDDVDANSGSRNLQFSASLSRMRRDAANARMERESMALGAGRALPLAYEAASPWDIWVEGRYSAFDDDNGNLDRKGHVGVLYVGGDYRIAKNMIVGALAQFDRSKDDSGVLTSKANGNGWMVGPYMSMQVRENIYLDLRAAWGASNNDLTVGAVTGGFDTSRWLVKGTLTGNWLWDAWRITPTVQLAYAMEIQDAFTNSAGTFVPGQHVSLGRLQFGPEIGYRFAHSADTFVEPFMAIRGVWDFDNPNAAIEGFVVGPGNFWGRLESGLNVSTRGGVVVRGIASWDGVGTSDYSGYTLQGAINVPLN